MKRSTKFVPQIKSFFNVLIWRRCESCSQEFVREPGFQVKMFTRSQWNATYFCLDCGKSVEYLNQVIVKHWHFDAKIGAYIKRIEPISLSSPLSSVIIESGKLLPNPERLPPETTTYS